MVKEISFFFYKHFYDGKSYFNEKAYNPYRYCTIP